MNQIIVPIDFSEESMNGLELAVMISSKTRANIQLVYVMKQSSDFYQVSKDEEKRSAKNKLQEIKSRYENKLGSGVKLSFIIKKGKIYDEVVEQVESYDDSIIVVSTHGASGFEEFFIGSNALKIITASERPVITIKHGVVPRNIRRILLPIDYTRDTRQKVPYTLKMAKSFQSTVHIMGISTGQDQELSQRIKSWMNQVSEYFTENDVAVNTTYQRGENVTDIIAEYVRKEKIDLISIMTDQGTAISNFILGSNAQQLISKSEVPVLCITPKELNIRSGFKTYGGVPPA